MDLVKQLGAKECHPVMNVINIIGWCMLWPFLMLGGKWVYVAFGGFCIGVNFVYLLKKV